MIKLPLPRSVALSGRGTFTDYHQAHYAACALARHLGLDVGITKAKEYTKSVFQVAPLPTPQFCFGYEANAERISPTDPLSDRDVAAAEAMGLEIDL